MVAKMLKTRKIIYVDATGEENNTIFKISLVDVEKNINHVLNIGEIKNNTEAEKFAIFYAIFYIKKHDYTHCHILCDNQSAVNDLIIRKIIQRYAIGLSWIPREINDLADTLAKSKPTLDELEWNQLKLFIELLREPVDSAEIVLKQKEEIENLKSTLTQKNQKIQNQATQINSLRSKKS
jgi:hypothetical protein